MADDLQPLLDPTHLAVARYSTGWRIDSPLDRSLGFTAVLDDGEETTLVCPEALLDALDDPPSAVERGWRRISFPGPLPWEMVGFLADVAGRLAEARIPLAAMAGFTTDHVLVRAAHADLAVSVLQGHPAPAPRPGLPG
jgi:hypothetical protein